MLNKVPSFQELAQAQLDASELPPDSRKEIRQLLAGQEAEEQYMGDPETFIPIQEAVRGQEMPVDYI